MSDSIEQSLAQHMNYLFNQGKTYSQVLETISTRLATKTASMHEIEIEEISSPHKDSANASPKKIDQTKNEDCYHVGSKVYRRHYPVKPRESKFPVKNNQ